MTQRIPVTPTTWVELASGEAHVIVTVENGGARVHVGTADEPDEDAPGHYLDGKTPFNGQLNADEVLWAKGQASLVVTP